MQLLLVMQLYLLLQLLLLVRDSDRANDTTR